MTIGVGQSIVVTGAEETVSQAATPNISIGDLWLDGLGTLYVRTE